VQASKVTPGTYTIKVQVIDHTKPKPHQLATATLTLQIID
jgi:hypothetical protein